MPALRHISKKSSNTWSSPGIVSAPPQKSSAKFAMLFLDLGFRIVFRARVYAFCATVAAFLVPITSLLNLKRPLWVQNEVISLVAGSSGMLQYCLSPSAENLYLNLAALYISLVGSG